MIQEIQLSNFKAFADTVRIPIKPITLIFGPNSSGKSSFFQALLMLKQTLEESVSGEQSLLPKGKLVDLGNFREFIHNHDESLSFSVTFKIAPSIDLFDALPTEDYFLNSTSASKKMDNLHKSIESLPIGITFSFSFDNTKEVHVSKLDLLVGDDPVPVITYVNEPPESMESLADDATKKDKDQREHQWRIYRISPKSYLKFKKIEDHEYWKIYFKSIKEEQPRPIMKFTKEERELLSRLDISLNPITQRLKDDFLTLSKFLPVELNGYHPQYLTSDDCKDWDNDGVSVLTLVASYTIKAFLLDCVHLGPVRHKPERNFFFSGIISPYVGVNGQYTNEILVTNSELVKKVNKQLSSLNLGYKVKIVPLASASSDVKVSTIRLASESGIDLAITDVGYGISQVLPIIAQSMMAEGKTILIEQPELHLHPAQQAELGSFFASCIRPETIKSLNGEDEVEKSLPNKFIIETHSENIILRLQKLIRKGELKKEDLAVIYFNKTAEGSVAQELRLNDLGEFIDPWPNGFFEESFKEMFGD